MKKMKFKVEAKLCLELGDYEDCSYTLQTGLTSGELKVKYYLYRSHLRKKFIIYGNTIEEYAEMGTFHTLELVSDVYDHGSKKFLKKTKNEEVENYLNNPILIKNKLEDHIIKMIKKEFNLNQTPQELKVNKINEKGILDFEFEFDEKEQKNDD